MRVLCLVVGVCAMAVGARAQTITLSTGHPEVYGRFGGPVAVVPDENGDGVDDIAVGAPNQDVGTLLNAGRVTIHSGATGAILKVIVSPGKQELGRFGASIAGIADLTGDGIGDLVIGAPNENNQGTPETGTGRVYLINGSTGKWVRTFSSPNAEPGGGFGCSVAALADATGDGKPDFAVGALREDPNAAPDNAGRAYIFNSATGAMYKTLVSGNQVTDGYFGACLATVPDATGDGKADLVVGSPGETAGGKIGAGRAHLYNGVTGALWKVLTPGKPELNGRFGNAVGGVPDVNGDGRGDVVSGAPSEDVPGVYNAGRVYLHSGASGSVLRSFALGAPESNDAFGIAVCGMPDVNGDGFGDVLIGASGADPGGAPADSGRAYIFSGANGAFIRSIGSPNAQATGNFGSSVAALPDTKTNNKPEAVIGAPSENTAFGEDVGRAYIVKN